MADLNDMMVFLAVVERGSFTHAANDIGLPKSNVSRKISRLEEQLGVRLLERSTRSLHLTEVGRIYHEHCVRIHEEVVSAENCVESMAAIPRGWVKLCASVTIGQALLAPWLPEFNTLFPEVHVDLRLTNRRIDIIEEGYDLTIRVGESPDSSLISKKLCAVNLHLFASPDYLGSALIHKQGGKNLSVPNDLLNHQCLFMSAMGDKPSWELYDTGNKTTIDFTPYFVSDDFGVIYQMALSGLGIALLPDYLCSSAEKDNKLVRVLDDWVGRNVNIYAIYPSRKGVTPKIRVLLDFLADRLGNERNSNNKM